MRQQKTTWCILLTLMMMVSLLVITHVPAFAADGDIVNGSEPKWVEAQVTDQGEYCFDAQYENGLYDNFVFCLVDSDKTPPALDDFNDAQVVLSRSAEMRMTGTGPNAKNAHNCYHLGEIDASAGTMTGAWETDHFLDDECVYVKADSVFGIDADLWAFTWKDDAYLTEHGEVLPTYADGIYHSGTNLDQTWYTDNYGHYYIENDSSYERIEEDQLFCVPYFEFARSEGTVKLTKCNSEDEEITIPETIPDNYPTENMRGESFDTIAGGAFFAKTDLTRVVMGDNIRRIESAYEYDAGIEIYTGAFECCSNLAEVSIGTTQDAMLEQIDYNAFGVCKMLKKITCTSLQGNPDDLETDWQGLRQIAYDNSRYLIVYCYHDSVICRVIRRERTCVVRYLDETVTHDYTVQWFWYLFDDNADEKHVGFSYECNICWEQGTYDLKDVKVYRVVDIPPTGTAEGSGHYEASAVLDGKTYTDDDGKKHTFTIPAFGNSDFILPADIKMVDESAFEGTGVTVLCVPDGCESIGKNAFKGCAGLKQIFIPASVTFIDPDAFIGRPLYIYGPKTKPGMMNPTAAWVFCQDSKFFTFVEWPSPNAG